MVGDLHKKNKHLQMRLAEVQEGLIQLRRTQLHLFYCGLGLEEPTDDIAADVHCARLILGEFPATGQSSRSTTPSSFVAEVQEALSLDSLDNLPLPSQRSLEGLDAISTQDLSMSKLNIGHASPTRMSPPPPLSPQELLCSMHVNNPCTPTAIHERAGEGPWLSRTPSLTPTLVPNSDNHAAIQTSNNISGCAVASKDHDGMVTGSEAASEVVEQPCELRDNSPIRPTAVDVSYDDVLARTTHKSDGR